MRVLIADPLDPSGYAVLRESGAELREVGEGERGELPALLTEADALVVRSTTRVTRALLEAAPRLRVVGRAGIGVDNIDVDAATALGIVVVNAPSANLISAAEHTFALLLALARRIPSADASMKAGRWERETHMGVELAGRLLGLVGFGRIGRLVAERARAFAMRVAAADPFVEPSRMQAAGVSPLSLDELLRSSDVVSLHLPASPATRGILSRERLLLMKEGALLVNCARGGLVDEAALLERLESGRLAGVALDVFEQEPTSRLELVRHPRVVATPHLGARTREAQARMSEEVARELLLALAGAPGPGAVNSPPRPRG